MLPRSSRATLRVVVLTLVRLVVLFVGALAGGSVVILDEHADVTGVRSYTDVADVDQTFLVVWAAAWHATGWLPLIIGLPRRRVFSEVSKDSLFRGCAELRLWGMVSSSSMPRERKHPVAALANQRIFISPDEGAHLLLYAYSTTHVAV